MIKGVGQVAQLGTPGEMYEYPANRFVADFLGDVNVVEARVVEAGRDLVRVHSAEAGCDIVLASGDPSTAIDMVRALVDQARDDPAFADRIDQSAARVLDLKTASR